MAKQLKDHWRTLSQERRNSLLNLGLHAATEIDLEKALDMISISQGTQAILLMSQGRMSLTGEVYT